MFYWPLPLKLLISLIGRAGVPMEVMGLMLGEFVDDYTVRLMSLRQLCLLSNLCFISGARD